MARSEDHQHDRSGPPHKSDADDKKEEAHPRRKSDTVTHEDIEALKAWVRQEIALAASGVPHDERVERNA